MSFPFSSCLGSALGREYVVAALATIGGVIMFCGSLIKRMADWMNGGFLGGSYRPHKTLEQVGWCVFMFGIAAEVAIAAGVTVRAYINETKNSPLIQPASNVSAILRFVVSARTYQPHNPISLDGTSLSFGSISFEAKELRWYEHLDTISPPHAAYYAIALKFEPSTLPAWEWNDINHPFTNYFAVPTMTVTNLMTNIDSVAIYIGFMPKDAYVVKGDVRIQANGFNRYFPINSNNVSGDMTGWNPTRAGLFITITNHN